MCGMRKKQRLPLALRRTSQAALQCVPAVADREIFTLSTDFMIVIAAAFPFLRLPRRCRAMNSAAPIFRRPVLSSYSAIAVITLRWLRSQPGAAVIGYRNA